MSFLKTVNAARRTVVRRLVKDLAEARVEGIGPEGKSEVKNILICRPNHRLGNLLLITPLLTEIARTLPAAKVDLFVKGNIPPIIFKNYHNIDRIIALPKKPFKSILPYVYGWIKMKRKRYDIVINVVWNSGSGTIATRLAWSRFVFHGDVSEDNKKKYADYRHMGKYPVYLFRDNLAKLGISSSEDKVPSLDLRLSPEEIVTGKETLDQFVKNDRPTIALYTFATGSKCYSTEWWEDMYDRLKRRYPDYNIIEVLPIENVSQIGFSAPSFYSRDLRLIGSVIAHVDIFIGADSGMMHLASAANARVVGLFKAANMDTYAPYNTGSVGINTNETDVDACLKIIDGIMSANLSARMAR